MSNKTLKVISGLTTVVGAVISIISAWVGAKQTDALITEKVAKEVAKLTENK